MLPRFFSEIRDKNLSHIHARRFPLGCASCERAFHARLAKKNVRDISREVVAAMREAKLTAF